jgi:hypothetical protein
MTTGLEASGAAEGEIVVAKITGTCVLLSDGSRDSTGEEGVEMFSTKFCEGESASIRVIGIAAENAELEPCSGVLSVCVIGSRSAIAVEEMMAVACAVVFLDTVEVEDD